VSALAGLGKVFIQGALIAAASVALAPLKAADNTSTINAQVSNIGGSMSMTSGAIGNKAQILHYSTN